MFTPSIRKKWAWRPKMFPVKMILEITSKDIMMFTEIKGTPPRGFPFWREPWRPTWKIRSPDALTSTATTSATLVEFGPALLQVPGPTGRQAISPMVTCVGTRNWSTPELSEISASCWCFNGQFWPQDTPNPQKGHNRSIQMKKRIRLILIYDTTTVAPKLSLI